MVASLASTDTFDPIAEYRAACARQGLTAGTITQSERLIRSLLDHAGVTYPAQVTTRHVEAWLASRVARQQHAGKRGEKVSGKTLNTYLVAVRRFFDWAVRAEIARENPATDVRWSGTTSSPSRPKRRKRRRCSHGR